MAYFGLICKVVARTTTLCDLHEVVEQFAPLGKRVVTGEIARLAKRRYVERLFDGAEFVQN